MTFHITAKDLAALGTLPKEFVPSCSLVYSSPGTLSYNSPGALGFGVKRAALVIPESVMLLVAPDCCGRNSTILSENEGYASRMFYLRMTETDLITGSHLKLIPEAVKEVCKSASPCPKVVVICVTCVDALLGTDVVRVCRQAEKEVPGVRVVPSYMYALTREGTRPPMTAIRETIYSLLERLPVKSCEVNLMGYFSPLSERSELFCILHSMGIKTVREVSRAKTLDEYMQMGRANFNIVLDKEACFAAERLKERLGMPYIEITRLYDTERIAKQYRLLAKAAGANLNEDALSSSKADADEAVEGFRSLFGRPPSFAIGQMLNASPFELAASLCKAGFSVPCVIASPTEAERPFVRLLAALSPGTKIFPPTHPSASCFDAKAFSPDIAVGKDIAGVFARSKSVEWYGEEEPFGFAGVKDFFDACSAAIKGQSARGCL